MARIPTARPRITATNSKRVPPPPKTRDDVYGMPEYQRWRARVIARSGNMCQDPAHDPSQPRSGIRLYADHVIEIKDDGDPFDPANGLARCAACHGSKTSVERKRRAGT